MLLSSSSRKVFATTATTASNRLPLSSSTGTYCWKREAGASLSLLEQQQQEEPLMLVTSREKNIGGVNVHLQQDGRRLSIITTTQHSHSALANNNSTVQFDAPWLWINCPTSIHQSTGQRLRSPGQYSGQTIRSCEMIPCAVMNKDHQQEDEEEASNDNNGFHQMFNIPRDSCHPVSGIYNSTPACDDHSSEDTIIRVTWSDETSPVSYYNVDWLRRFAYDTASLNASRTRREVAPQHAIRSDSELTRVDYDRIQAGDEASVLALLEAIFSDGVACVKGAPILSTIDEYRDDGVLTISKAIGGYPSHGSLYGDTFEVKSEANAINIAYTNVHLCPHQDLAYYESMPGIQLLHCIEFGSDVVGGDSILIDCMAAAYALREIAPCHFKTLVATSATFMKQRKGASMTYQRPHIVLRTNEDFNDMDREIIGVNWSPPFEGPLSTPPHMVEAYFAAYSAFERMLDVDISPHVDNAYLSENERLQYHEYAKKYTYQKRLTPGEILVFSNRRMLHGRKGFYSEISKPGSSQMQGNRLFKGCYTDIDDTLNHYKVLRRKFEPSNDGSTLNVGNGTNSFP